MPDSVQSVLGKRPSTQEALNEFGQLNKRQKSARAWSTGDDQGASANSASLQSEARITKALSAFPS